MCTQTTWKWLHSPYCIGGPTRPARDNIGDDCLNPPSPGAQMWGEWQHNPHYPEGHQCAGGGQNHKWILHPCLVGAQVRATCLHKPYPLGGHKLSFLVTKSEMVGKTLLYRGPTGQNGYRTLATRGVPNGKCGDKIREGLRKPSILADPKIAKINHNWLVSPGRYLSPHGGKLATDPMLSMGSPTPNGRTTLEMAAETFLPNVPKRGHNG